MLAIRWAGDSACLKLWSCLRSWWTPLQVSFFLSMLAHQAWMCFGSRHGHTPLVQSEGKFVSKNSLLWRNNCNRQASSTKKCILLIVCMYSKKNSPLTPLGTNILCSCNLHSGSSCLFFPKRQFFRCEEALCCRFPPDCLHPDGFVPSWRWLPCTDAQRGTRLQQGGHGNHEGEDVEQDGKGSKGEKDKSPGRGAGGTSILEVRDYMITGA